MSFVHPAILLLLLLLPLLAGLKIRGGWRARRAAGKIASARLLPGLLVDRGRWRSWTVFLLETGALGCFIIALARPQYGYLEEEGGGSGRSLIIAIDTSKSMLCDDLKPSRLQRAQLAAADLIKRLSGDRIGLMPFAGNAFLYAPVTPDIDALLDSLDSLDTDIIPRGGSNLARPLDLALETFAKIGAEGQQVLILFSDGESLEGETLAAAKRAAERKMTVICVGIGTAAGGTIPDPEAPGGFHRDRDGKVVITRLEKEALVSIAKTTGGLYLPLEGATINDNRLNAVLSTIERSAMKGKVTKIAIDRYRVPLGAGLVLLLASWIAGITRRHFFQSRFRVPPPLPSPPSNASLGSTPSNHSGVSAAGTGAGVVAVVILLGTCLLNPPAALAAPAEAAKEIKNGNPWELYREGDFKSAQHNFETRLAEDTADPALAFGKGAAAFKNKDYDTAVDAFGAAVLSKDLKLRAQSHYNLANAIYQRTSDTAAKAKPGTWTKLAFIDGLIRQLENSLENYQQSLVLDPGNADTRANHDTTDDLIQKLRKIRKALAQQQGEGQDQKDGKQKKKGGRRKGPGEQGQGSPGGDGEGNEPSGKSGPNGENQGKGNRKPGEEGENGDKEDEDSDGGKPDREENGEGTGREGETEKEAREKSNRDRQGDIGTADNGKTPKDDSETGTGTDEGPEDPNRVANSVPGEGDGDPGTLDQYSDEDTKVRPRIDSAPEARPRKDW